MPVGPLSLTDEVALELLHGIRRQTKADLGDAYRGNRSDEVLALMVEKLKRKGRKSGGGFYDYPAEGDKFLWPGLAGHFPVRADVNEFEQIKRRLIYVQCLEAARCLEENVLTDPRDGDVGSVLGWGFPAFRGGVISQIHSLGIGVFVEQCEELADAHGERFTPPRLLRDMAAGGRAFYEF
jgi:3-hydroxyacyl-CoA dehydrogenase/enoyl-CoA hydratase/3-hydroxybutyryl-CoA epimerase